MFATSESEIVKVSQVYGVSESFPSLAPGMESPEHLLKACCVLRRSCENDNFANKVSDEQRMEKGSKKRFFLKTLRWGLKDDFATTISRSACCEAFLMMRHLSARNLRRELLGADWDSMLTSSKFLWWDRLQPPNSQRCRDMWSMLQPFNRWPDGSSRFA